MPNAEQSICPSAPATSPKYTFGGQETSHATSPIRTREHEFAGSRLSRPTCQYDQTPRFQRTQVGRAVFTAVGHTSFNVSRHRAIVPHQFLGAAFRVLDPYHTSGHPPNNSRLKGPERYKTCVWPRLHRGRTSNQGDRPTNGQIKGELQGIR